MEGVELHYVRRGKSEDTAEHRMTENIEGVFDEYWREKILEASKRGMDTKARSGKLVGGRAPYGYKYHEGELRIDDFEANIVRQIFTWYVIGDETGKPLTLYRIAKRLSETGVPTPGEARNSRRQRDNSMWCDGSISRILSYEVYLGVFRYGRLIGSSGKNGKRVIDDTIAIDVPALIDRALWQAAQDRKEYNRAMSARNGRREYLLRGRLFCGCGRRMVGYNSRKGKYYRYKCGAVHLPGVEDRVCHEPVYDVIGRKVEAWAWEEIFITP